MLKIARMNVMPPGGYQYVQPDTGMKFGGNETFKSQCRLILVHRKGNHLPRASFAEVGQDVVEATCKRVPGICTQTAMTATAAVVSIGIGTVAIGPAAPRPVRKCKSCGGRKAKK